VAIRADESLKVNTSCRHRATFFLVAPKTTHRVDTSMFVS
jgi:hypothetical protein